MAQRIWKESLDKSWVEEPADPVDTLAEVLAQMDAVVEDFASLAETTRNDSVRVAALKWRHNALATKVQLMQVCGLLPREYSLKGAISRVALLRGGLGGSAAWLSPSSTSRSGRCSAHSSEVAAAWT
jgi:hypothetical protein